MSIRLIVEGIYDKQRLAAILDEEVIIHCTYGTLGTSVLEELIEAIGEDDVYIFTDNDSSGTKIRAKLREYFPEAVHLYTRKEYGAVEKTPEDYLISQLEKAGLEEYVVTHSSKPALWTKDEL